MDLLLNTYKLFKDIQKKKTDYFSGIGLVVYDENKFDRDSHCDLRPEIKCPQYSINDEAITGYLLKICEHTHTLHDGFHMVNSQGILTHVAQYFVPGLNKQLKPNQDHGVRLYSSMCGSILEGVLFIGVISSDNHIFIFQNGSYINLKEMELKLQNEDRQVLN